MANKKQQMEVGGRAATKQAAVALVEYERYIELLTVHGNRDGKYLASFLEERILTSAAQ